MAPKTSITIHYYHPPDPAVIKYCYTVIIFGHHIFTTATSHPDVLTEWIKDVAKHYTSHRYVGFEFELDINTTRVSTLQFCMVDRCIVFQLDRKSPFPASLLQFLLDENNTFVSSHVEAKVAMLKAHYPFVGTVKGVEVGQLTPFVRDVKRRELDSMALGEVESKWDRLPEKLTVGQVHYACLNAFLNLHIMFVSNRSQTPA